MAQVPSYPQTIFFYCFVPALEGGQTPLVLSSRVCNRLSNECPEFIEKLDSLGVIYKRILPDYDDPSSAIGRSWRSTFNTEVKEEAKNKAKEIGVELEFLDNGDCVSISSVTKAIRNHPTTGERVFFNSVVAAYVGWRDSRNDPVEAVRFGDGSMMNPDQIEIAKKILDEECCDLMWNKGDVAWVDNNAVLHARRSFKGERRIMAALFR